MNLHKIVHKNVQEIINSCDPVGLISGGAPDDEYDSQVNQITSILRNETDKRALSVQVESVFKESFGKDFNIDKNIYLIISEKLIELKTRLNWR